MFKEKVLAFDKEFLELYQLYINEHEKLNKFRGQTVEGDEAVNEINGHLKAIHALFNQIMPYIKYIQDRNEFVTNVYNQYVSFIEELKQNGAVLVEAEQKEVIN